ncbi:MAG: 5-(carboxyamino)imidazole ribonucleotide synthase [Cellvibrionales bacterium]|nr:5-(carboxyamino)imidazole ribonucleotide synthase [Cellvibrionales bacterium]
MKVGILGTGQLALMMAQANQGLGLEIIPFGGKGGKFLSSVCAPVEGDLNDQTAVDAFIDSVDVVTYESENTPVDSLIKNAEKIAPTLDALKLFQNRLLEKNFLVEQGLKTVNYQLLSTPEELDEAATTIGFPAILKTVTEGYDGRGQCLVKSLDELKAGFDELNQYCIMEGFVDFDQEISIVAVRDKQKNIAFYPVAENFHRSGQLRLSIVDGEHPLQKKAEDAIRNLLEKLDYVGCMAMEFFVKGDQLLVNEMAPRVHNSGHWTMDGADQSQFYLHIKAVAGQAISTPVISQPVAMVNCIGDMPADTAKYDRLDFVSVYDYGKEPRAERKVGHINVLGNDQSKAEFFNTLAAMLDEANETSLADLMRDRATSV